MNRAIALLAALAPMLLATWSELGGSATGFGLSNDPAAIHQSPSMALDSTGAPIVAWQATNPAFGTNDIRLARWDGAAWVGLGGSDLPDGLSATPTDSLEPSLGINPLTGNPAVAWSEQVGANFEVHYREWDGAAWQELGGSGTGAGVSGTATDSLQVSLAFSTAGQPWIAWTEMVGGGQIYMRHWNGINWVETSGSGTGNGVSNSPGACGHPSLEMQGAVTPHVAYENFAAGLPEICLRFHNGAIWTGLAGSHLVAGLSANPGASRFPSLALDGAGQPAVAWVDDTAGPAVYFRRWNGVSWEELAGSATGLGLSQSTGPIDRTSLALEGSGNPVIAWADASAGSFEILVARWTGAAWTDYGGSTALTGVSNNAGASISPSLSLNPVGLPHVAWADSTSGGMDILMAFFPGAPPPPPGSTGGGFIVHQADATCPSCGKCGLLGIEPVLMVALIWAARRRRTTARQS